jgi:hypothetical protein
MSAKKEKLIKITKDEDGSEVRVYMERDQENPYLTGEPRFIHKENDNAEEVEMRPFEISIDELKEKQDMWLLYPDKALENKLNLRIPIESEDALLPKEWLTNENWSLYLGQVIEQMFHWKNKNGPLPLETAKTLRELEQEFSRLNAKTKKNNARRQSSHHLIIWKVYTALVDKLGYTPSARNVWDELERNSRDYDPTSKVIEDISVDALEWFDTKGKKKLFPRSALDTLLSRMRKNPPE